MSGSRFVGLGVAAALVAGLVFLPALVVAGFYAFANVYALITGSDFSAEAMNLAVFLTGLALTVAAVLVLVAVAAGVIGRSLSPERREAEPFALDEGILEP